MWVPLVRSFLDDNQLGLTASGRLLSVVPTPRYAYTVVLLCTLDWGEKHWEEEEHGRALVVEVLQAEASSPRSHERKPPFGSGKPETAARAIRRLVNFVFLLVWRTGHARVHIAAYSRTQLAQEIW